MSVEYSECALYQLYTSQGRKWKQNNLSKMLQITPLVRSKATWTHHFEAQEGSFLQIEPCPEAEARWGHGEAWAPVMGVYPIPQKHLFPWYPLC